MLNPPIPKHTRRNREYVAKSVAAAFGSVVLATLVRLILYPVLGEIYPFLTYFMSVIFCSWLLGFRAGLLSTLMSLLAADYFFIPPIGSLGLISVNEFAAALVFIAEGVAIAALGDAQLQSRLTIQTNEEHLRLATEGSGVGTWRWDVRTRRLTCSEQLRVLFGNPSLTDGDFEAFFNEVYPEDRDLLREAISAAIQANKNFDAEIRVTWPDRSNHWLVVRGHGHRDSRGAVLIVEGIAIDITARKDVEEASERRAQYAGALNTISKAIREMRGSNEILRIILPRLATILNADRCLVVLLDKQQDRVSIVSEWHGPNIADLLSEYRLTSFDVDLDELFPNVSPLVVNDVADGHILSHRAATIFQGLQMKALVAVPMSYSGEIVSALGVCMADTTRLWTQDEIAFADAVASQLRSAIESARMLTDAQNRAEREALINRISDAIRTIDDADEIQKTAVTLLGRALTADRCYFALYDLEQGEVLIGEDWHRPDLPTVSGTHAFKNTREMFAELYPKDSVSMIYDRDDSSLSGQTIENMKALQLRSRLSVAIADRKGMATLTAAMSDGPRYWTSEDIELVKRVASQLRPSIEMARLRQREHRIAADLQAALIPPAPNFIPGLKIATCMLPALDEAEIGGDFFDVFALGENRHAIVIGDVSGKGLTAAAQLSTVRICVRMALYQEQSPAIAMADVNTILTEHELLSGFVTVFVGVYDSSDGSLTHTSCGHEPALVYRCSDRSVETIAVSGLPIGVAEGHIFDQGVIKLLPGDTLVLYTDGISEAGPNRFAMLETEGLRSILCDVGCKEDADDVAKEIIIRARAHASGSFRDDVCVLVAHRVDEIL